MAKGPMYKVPKRRRREGKTNYYRRYIYVLSRATRLVVRKSNRYITLQIIRPTPIGDITLASVHTSELIKRFGWKGDSKNISAAYLAGLLLGIKARLMGVEKAVLDIGLHTPSKGAKVFAAVKGAIDAGLKVPVDEDMIPSWDRIRGADIARYAEELFSKDPERFKRQFSEILSRGLDPRRAVEHFEEVFSKIVELGRKLGVEVKAGER
jgi:large subunit ribosomal protein L18